MLSVFHVYSSPVLVFETFTWILPVKVFGFVVVESFVSAINGISKLVSIDVSASILNGIYDMEDPETVVVPPIGSMILKPVGGNAGVKKVKVIGSSLGVMLPDFGKMVK